MLATALVLLLAAPEAPAEIHRILPVRIGEVVGAWATPISPRHLVTAAHVAEHVEALRVEIAPGQWVGVELLWSSDKDDLALLMLAGPGSVRSVKFCGREPAVAERVWYRILLVDRAQGYTFGHVLGRDHGMLMVAGWAHPGVSGGGLLSDEGCLLGTISGGGNWAGSPGEAADLRDALVELNRKTHFSPVVTVAPMKKWPSRP